MTVGRRQDVNDVRLQRQKLGQSVVDMWHLKPLRLLAGARDVAINYSDDFGSRIPRNRAQMMARDHATSNDADLHSCLTYLYFRILGALGRLAALPARSRLQNKAAVALFR